MFAVQTRDVGNIFWKMEHYFSSLLRINEMTWNYYKTFDYSYRLGYLLHIYIYIN